MPPQTTTEANGPINLLRPLLLLCYSAYYIPITIYTLVTTGDIKSLSSFSDFKEAWFAHFW
ncbi:hypothetical protein LTR86_009127 [Recurvomyces mirabilis]|nr:hypothetical protein LTR86_009127 [Recurvomyces mirabilis]